jgi:hypothetical protein
MEPASDTARQLPAAGIKFPAAERAAERVRAAAVETWLLRARVQALREELACAEAEARLCGPCAQAMPEDFDDWAAYGPRVQGLAVRICQTQAQSQALADAAGREAAAS